MFRRIILAASLAMLPAVSMAQGVTVNQLNLAVAPLPNNAAFWCGFGSPPHTYQCSLAQILGSVPQLNVSQVWTASQNFTGGLSASGAAVLVGVSQAPGTATNDNASTGNLGEFVTSSVTCTTATGLTSGTSANVTSISLTAGDWDVWGVGGIDPAGSTTTTKSQVGINTTSATLPAAGASGYVVWSGSVAGTNLNLLTPGPVRVSLASAGSVYLVVQGTFTASTAGPCGAISARRVR